MKRPRIKTTKKNPETTYIILPEYLKERAALNDALKIFPEQQRFIAYAEENGARDSDIITGLCTLLVQNCEDTIAERKHPKILKGDNFLKENGYRDDILDDLY
jgi:hypothetical protein